MKKACLALAAVLLLTALALLPRARKVQAQTITMPKPHTLSFEISLGVGDREPTAWDGRVRVSGGEIASIEGIRFAAADSTDGKSTWKLSTHHAAPGAANAAAKAKAKKKAGGPMLPNGVVIAVAGAGPETRFEIQTANGNFAFTPAQAPFGEALPELGGRALVERVPNTVALTTSTDDQDFPALAQTSNELLLTYIEFAHSDRSQERNGQLSEAPKNFDFLSRPAGGDRVKLMRFSKDMRTWSTPEDVSPAHEDAMRAAVAVDGEGRAWVVWSANRGGNYDLFARYRKAGRWSPEMRLTNDAGTDINPVATTDSNGHVWVAWQAFRDGNLEVMAMAQTGEQFSKEEKVSFSAASDWDPAIAAGPNGEVAVTWDTYDKGDYDVYLRRMRFENGAPRMDAPAAVAASQNFEARSSAAYDAQGRLWVAYEASAKKWGKDFGAYEKTGVALYQGHTMRVKCFQGGQVFETQGSLDEAIARDPQLMRPGVPAQLGQQQAQMSADQLANNPVLTAATSPGPRHSFPRIAADPAGRIYLTFRATTGERSPVGTSWDQYVTFYDGAKWSKPVPIPESDGLLDLRPAMAVMGPSELMMVAIADHRQDGPRGRRRAAGGQEAINCDLYAAAFALESPAAAMQLKPVAAEKVAAPDEGVKPERADIAAMRRHRVTTGGAQLQLMRGEFHRHTEISADGGGDGPLVDAYRYLIDAADMDWAGCCDHDNGGGREYTWWLNQKLTDAYHLGDRYVPMFAYERSVRYPEGHRNVVFPKRGIRPLPRLPKMDDDSAPAHAPDTQMLYSYLRAFGGIVASHTSATDMGTDWRDNDPVLEPVVEIYQGDRQNYEMPDAPRAPKESYSIGGWRPLGFVSLALQKGYRLGFQASSDHISTHMSYCNLWVTSRSREAIMEAFHKRRIYGATDNILADVRSGPHFMGEEFSTTAPPVLQVKLWGTADFAKVHIIRDSKIVYSVEPGKREVVFEWKDSAAERGKTSYYYVRGEQKDGELVWVSPMWITYQ